MAELETRTSPKEIWEYTDRALTSNVKLIDMFRHAQRRTYLGKTDVGTAYTTIPYHEICLDFTELKIKRVGFFARAEGSETGTKGMEIYNATDGVSIASTTWSGSDAEELAGASDVTLTGIKKIAMRWKGSTATEDLYLYDLIIFITVGV